MWLLGQVPARSYSSSPDSEWPWVKASTQSVVLSALSPVKIDGYEQIKLNKLNIITHLKKIHCMIVLQVCYSLYFLHNFKKYIATSRELAKVGSYYNTSKKNWVRCGLSLLEYSL